jgi:acyl transferase domain-containing protein/acyl carrier protein
MVQAARHGVMPKLLHHNASSSEVDWSAGSVEPLTENLDWPRGERPRRSAVSAFGISGTNAHVILEEADEPEFLERPELGVAGWLLSGRTAGALADTADRLLSHVDGQLIPDIGYTLAAGRARFEHRAVVVGHDRETLRAGLADLSSAVTGVADVTGRTVFVFPGQGSQWRGMAVELLDAAPVFASRIDECAHALESFVDWSLLAVLRGEPGAPSLDRVDVVQPVLWAVMVSLAELWQEYGIRPDAVLGHSQGEIAAACVAGILSLEDGARVVALRSAAIRDTLAGRGGLLSAGLGADEVRPRLIGGLSVAAVNGARSVVVAGPDDELDALTAALAADGVRVKRVPVDYASHSAHVEEIEDRLLRDLGPIVPRAGDVPMLSTVTGAPVGPAEADARYWYENLRRTVQFAPGIELLAEQGHTAFVEVSPHPVLAMSIQETLEAHESPTVVTGTLRRDDGGLTRMLTSLAELSVRGVDVDWARLYPEGRRVELPTYPFQRKHYWAETQSAPGTADAWRYRVAWSPVADRDSALAGTWLVAVPAERDERTKAVVAGLAAHGADVVELTGDFTESRPAAGVVSLLDLDGTAELLRALDIEAPVWSVTSGAVAASAGDVPGESAQLWGFGTALAVERPGTWGGLIDLPETIDDTVVRRLCRALSGEDGDQLAIRESGVLARRLVRAPRRGGGSWRPRGTALVTGGTGGLGVHVARWLAEQGAEHLLLLSRSGPDAAGAEDLEAELLRLGAKVTIAACDVADPGTLARCIEAGTADHPLTTVVHAAGLAGLDLPVATTSPAEFAEVGRAKIEGARNLDALTEGMALDAFVVFSSGAAIWGSAGQSAYAAANSYLDALVHRRRARGAAGTSIAWGAWEGGMSAGAIGDQLRRIGVRPMAPRLALDVLRQTLEDGESHLVVTDIDWARFAPAYSLARPRPLLAELPDAVAALAGDEPSGESRFATMTGTDRRRALLDLVRTQVCAVLGYDDASEIDQGRAFTDLGFESVTAVDLRNRLSSEIGRKLPATVVFDHASPGALASHLDSLFADGEPVADDEIARFERLVAGLAPEQAHRTRLRTRLRTLLTRLDTAEETAEVLETASHEDVFALIDQELGLA